MSVYTFPSMTKLIELHNNARSKSSWMWSINPLTVDDQLMKYASDWALKMSTLETMKHSRVSNIMHLGFKYAGENIAYGQKNEESVMKTWLWSPGHRRNIMNTKFTHIGCGFAYSNSGIPYWCVCFATPKNV